MQVSKDTIEKFRMALGEDLDSLVECFNQEVLSANMGSVFTQNIVDCLFCAFAIGVSRGIEMACEEDIKLENFSKMPTGGILQ